MAIGAEAPRLATFALVLRGRFGPVLDSSTIWRGMPVLGVAIAAGGRAVGTPEPLSVAARLGLIPISVFVRWRASSGMTSRVATIFIV